MHERVMRKIASANIDAYFVKNPDSINWLCGKGNYYLPGCMILTSAIAVLFTNSRNIAAFRKLYPEYEIISGGMQEAVRLCKDNGIHLMGFESSTLSFDDINHLIMSLPICSLVPLPDFIEDIMMVKTPDEIELLANAAKLSDAAYDEFLGQLRGGITERQAKNIFRNIIFSHGADDLAFDLLISSGPRTFLPHSASTDRVMEKGDLVLMDFGITLNGYCSDTSRTLVIGPPDERQKAMYELVRKAQKNAIENITAGMCGQEADALARNMITHELESGCYEYGLGHGIGMTVHEKPRMHPGSSYPLQDRTVVSVEPGIYIEGWGGIRIEDMLVIGRDKPGRVLTKASKEFLVI